MLKKKIAVLTATRAEYGLLRPVIKRLRASEYFQVELVVTGMHLSTEFGSTYKEIEQDGEHIDKKIEILLSSDTAVAMSKAMGLAMISFSEYFETNRPDAVLVLGDRYETLAVTCAAMNAQIPIIHMHGGEATEGLIDEAIRHAITKMSYLHLTSTEQYRKRVIQMGEQPERVFNVGATGVENALHVEIMSREELEDSLQCCLDRPYAVVTFHPVTLEVNSAKVQMQELLAAMSEQPEFLYLCTKANADTGGREINRLLDEYAKTADNIFVYESLGVRRYLSALKYADVVIGNSSSGIIEVPSFGIPTINIGDRQKGRIQADSIINCKPDRRSISESIEKARSTAFREIAKKTKNPYGGGNTSQAIVDLLYEHLVKRPIDLKKKFYDLDVGEV